MATTYRLKFSSAAQDLCTGTLRSLVSDGIKRGLDGLSFEERLGLCRSRAFSILGRRPEEPWVLIRPGLRSRAGSVH